MIIFGVSARVPAVLEKSLIFSFSLKSHWKWICPWKFLEFRGLSLQFQLVVLDFLFCVFWTESLNGYSKLRGARANFSQKNSARFARSSLQDKYFSRSSCSYYCYHTLRFPRIPTCIYVYYVFQCINLFQNGQSLLWLWHDNQACAPSRSVCRINSNKHFLGEDPQTPPPLSSRIVWGCIITIIQQII